MGPTLGAFRAPSRRFENTLSGDGESRPDARRSPRPAAYVAGAALVVGLAVSAYMAGANERFPGDLKVTTWVQSWRTDWLDTAFRAVTVVGVEYVAAAVILLAAAALTLAGQRRAAGLVVAASVAGFALRTALKLAIARPRPSDELVQVIERADGYSFPSGHVMFYTVLLGALWLVMATGGLSPVTRRAITGATVLALLLIGLSRIYLGAHWLSDVAAGYVFGAVVVGVAAWTRRWWDAAHAE